MVIIINNDKHQDAILGTTHIFILTSYTTVPRTVAEKSPNDFELCCSSEENCVRASRTEINAFNVA